MIFTADISTPKATAKVLPQRTTIPVRWGIVHKIEIDILSGHNDLTGIRLLHASIQRWPTSPESWFTGNLLTISFPVFQTLIHEPYFFIAETYNTDTVLAHSHRLRIGVLPPWAVYFTPKSQWDAWGERLFE